MFHICFFQTPACTVQHTVVMYRGCPAVHVVRTDSMGEKHCLPFPEPDNMGISFPPPSQISANTGPSPKEQRWALLNSDNVLVT